MTRDSYNLRKDKMRILTESISACESHVHEADRLLEASVFDPAKAEWSEIIAALARARHALDTAMLQAITWEGFEPGAEPERY